MNNTPIFIFDGFSYKKCAVCEVYMVHRFASQLRAKTCSHSCQLRGNKHRIGKKPANAYVRGDNVGVTNPNWKGDDVGYAAVHDWIKRHFGTPLGCEQCGYQSDNTFQFNWANISKEYRRVRSDWLRLCRKCHHAYDKISSKGWVTRRINIGVE